MNKPKAFECLTSEQVARVRAMRLAAKYTYRKGSWTIDKTYYWNVLAWNNVAI